MKIVHPVFPRDIPLIQEEVKGTLDAFFSQKGYVQKKPEPIIPRDDLTLIFNNSAIVNYKPYMRGEVLNPPGMFVIQPCVRTQSLGAKHDPSLSLEYMSYFKMFGAFANSPQYGTFAVDIWSLLTEAFELTPQRIRLHAAAEDESLLGPWRGMKQGPHIVVSTFPEEYYDWGFGVDGISGKGLTLAIRLGETEMFRDIGNIIEICRDNLPIGYGFGIGVETFICRLHDLEKPIEAATISRFVPYQDGPIAKYADLLQLAVVLYGQGLRPGRNGKESIVKKAVKGLLSSITHLNIPFEDCRKMMRNFEAAELGHSKKCTAEIIADLKKTMIKTGR